jgi:hypothetical protein
MAHPSKQVDLEVAWRALGSAEGTRDGWRTIALGIPGPFPVYAARFFPGSQEAILVDFGTCTLPPDPQLPHGKGFTVSRVPDHNRPGSTWVALRRNPNSHVDLFTVMAEDIAETLRAGSTHRSPEKTAQAFLARIKAWQEFMKRGRDRKLGPEAELGLVGELLALRATINAGLAAESALVAWTGPDGGLHDLQFGSGALEVKSCVATRDFPVSISSLEQLDPALSEPLFLMGLRFAVTERGQTLPTVIAEVQTFIAEADPESVSLFKLRLLQSGYLPGTEELYERRFLLNEWLVVPVVEDLPKLTSSTVPMGIRAATYILDLHSFRDRAVHLRTALVALGVVFHATR